MLRRGDLVFPELSYKIVGCAYEVFNELGFGHAEKVYQKAMAEALKNAGLNHVEQFYSPLKFKNKIVGKKFFDFLVDEKVVVEIKKNNFFSKANIDQLNEYLRSKDLQLRLLINFTSKGVIYKRLLNLNNRTTTNRN